MKIEIKSIYGNLLFEGDSSSLAEAVVSAVKNKSNLHGANLHGANLYGANLSGANLSGAENATLAIAMTRILPEGDLIGWKKSREGHIIKLLIPSDAKRSHAFGRKCRAEHAKVLEIWDGKKMATKASSHHDGGKTEYRAGKIVKPHTWCDDFTQECAGGIHFFITREEAEAYNL